MRKRIAIVGRGRVGGSIGRALTGAGHEIVASLGRGDAIDQVARVDVVVIAIPDDALADVSADVLGVAPADALVVHTCGSVGLGPLRSHGAMIGAIHPAVPVASSAQSFVGVAFGVAGTDRSMPDVVGLVEAMGGRAFVVDEGERIRYHAALVHASNHLVALLADAATLLQGDPANLLPPLARATLDNVERLGADAALTGPIVRGDATTIEKHLDALPDDLRVSYRENARRALALAIRSGRLDEERAREIADALDGRTR